MKSSFKTGYDLFSSRFFILTYRLRLHLLIKIVKGSVVARLSPVDFRKIKPLQSKFRNPSFTPKIVRHPNSFRFEALPRLPTSGSIYNDFKILIILFIKSKTLLHRCKLLCTSFKIKPKTYP